MPARCASSLPPSLFSSHHVFPSLASTNVSRSSISFLTHSLSLFPSFLYYVDLPSPTIFLSLSSSFVFISYPLRVSPSVFHYFLSFFFPLCISGSLSLSLRLCFVSFNSDRPFAKCVKRTLMGKRVKRKERGEKERKEGLERDGLIIERSSHRWERCLSVVDCTLNHCNVHRIFDFVAVTTVAPQTEFILIKRGELQFHAWDSRFRKWLVSVRWVSFLSREMNVIKRGRD